MKSKIRKIRTFPIAVRIVICLITGLVLGYVLGRVHPLVCGRCWIFNDIGESFIAFWPVILCFTACGLQEELIPTIAACIGAALTSSVLYRSHFYGSLVFLATVVGALSGTCFYYGRYDGWKASILRSLGLMPVFYTALYNWDGKPLWFQVLLCCLGIGCYLLAGRKNALKRGALVVQGVSMVLSVSFFYRALIFMAFLEAQPDYYP